VGSVSLHLCASPSSRHCHGTRPVLNVYEMEGAAGTLIAVAE
jgi:hypothetical protein